MLTLIALAAFLTAQPPSTGVVVVRGGHLFDGVRDARVPNPDIVIRGGRIATVGGVAPEGARIVEIDSEATVLPGLVDLHAHHGMSLFGRGRIDETEYYPRVFLANGVTTVFPAGEMNPERMAACRRAIDTGQRPGPRMLNSGPYFGSARPGWNRRATPAEVRAEVDEWAARGARGFKAKGIRPEQLRALIEQAHHHGLTVTGHLGSGHRGTVNPRDAILMGIDRVEHFLGGSGLPADRSAYASLEDLDPTSDDVQRIVRLFVTHRVNFDATLTAYGYFGERDPEVFTYWIDEREFFTPWFREQKKGRPERRVMAQFEKIYWIKRKTVKALYDGGGADLITLGTDHPSDGDYLSGFAAHRELHALVLSGIPAAAALRIATINGARAMGVGDRLGTIEPGKLADLFIVDGNPLTDIRVTRRVRLVMKAGETYDPKVLLEECRGKIGPTSEDEIAHWVGTWRRR